MGHPWYRTPGATRIAGYARWSGAHQSVWGAVSQAVRVPTRIVWGGLDRFNDPRFAEPSLAFCDDGQLVVYADAGHWLLREKSAETSELMIRFFGGS